MQVVNDPRPWWGMIRGEPLSIVELIANGTISAAGAGALWWALERGASLFVAAGPQLAGKTTLATALLPFLPEDARAYVTAGSQDRVVPPAGPGPLYLLINELSNHTPVYLAGPAALRAFALLRDGVRAIGTLHADSAQGAVEVMHQELGIPLADAARVTLVAVLRARRTAAGIERRVAEIGLLEPAVEGVRVTAVAERASWDGDLNVRPAPGGVAALARWAGVAPARAEGEIAARARHLHDLTAGGVLAPDAVTAAVAQFRQQERAGHATA